MVLCLKMRDPVSSTGRRWRQGIHPLELEVLGRKLFCSIEPVRKERWIFDARRYSPSGLTIALADITTAAWLGLMVYASQVFEGGEADIVKVAISGAIVAGLHLLLDQARSPSTLTASASYKPT